MNLQDFLSRLDGVKGHNNQYSAKCPAHDDHNASLSVSTGKDGKIIMKCHAGCEVKDILFSLGLAEKDLFQREYKAPQQKKWELVARYNYTDENGCFLFQKTRWNTAEGKTFTWNHQDISGHWQKGRGGRKTVLYNLQEVAGADTVYLVEGEKDVETLRGVQLVATSSPDGAGGSWQPSYTEALRGKIVYIIQDNDAPGKAFARKAATALYGAAKQIKVIDLTEDWDKLPEHGDATDAYNLTPQDFKGKLEALTITTPDFEPGAEDSKDVWERTQPDNKKTAYRLSTITAAELQKKEIPPPKYVVIDMLPQGLSLLASPPKYGKSWLVLDLCLSVAAGQQFLNHQTVKTGGLYLALEDSEYRLKDRMNKVLAGGKAPENFFYATSALDIGQGLIEQLETHLEEHPDTGLIVIDTLQKVRAAGSGKENAYSADYREIGLLKKFADRHGICLLLVHHLRKAGDDADPFNRISGTNGILGAVDTALVLSREKRNSEQTTLSITGRDIESREMILDFCKNTFKWQVLGDAERLAEQQARQEYNESPIVITIKKLLEQSAGRWSGSMQDLLDAGKYFANVYLDNTPQGLTHKVKSLDSALFQYDNIIHERAKNGKGGGKHHFYYGYSLQNVDAEDLQDEYYLKLSSMI